MTDFSIKVPRHLWIVGVLAVLWNAIGAFDYTASQLRLDFYMSQFTPEQLAYFYGFPAWAVAAWAIAVWGALLGSVGLLLRKAWAVWMFGLPSSAWCHVQLRADGRPDMMGTGGLMFTAVIWVIAFSLYFYARAMARRGVLR